MHLRKGKRLFGIRSHFLEIIQKASNNRITGMVHTNQRKMSTDFVMYQLDFGFMKLLNSTPSTPQNPIPGTIVRVKKSSPDFPKGIIGVCYERYKIGDDAGASFIFSNRSYDGFSKKDQELMLQEIGFAPSMQDYKFENVYQVQKDYINGKFDDVLTEHNFIDFYDGRYRK